jgi:hypothetical protein
MKSQFGKCENEVINVCLKRAIKNFPQHQAQFWSSRHEQEISALDFRAPKGEFKK